MEAEVRQMDKSYQAPSPLLEREAREEEPKFQRMSQEEIDYWLDDPLREETIKMWLAEGKTPYQIAYFLKYQG